MPIRARLTAVFALGALLLCLAGGYVFLRELGESLTAALDARLQQRAAAVASVIAAAGPAAAIGAPATEAGGQAVQVLDGGGHVVASTPGFDHAAVPAIPAGTQPFERNGVRAVARHVGGPDGGWTIVVAEPTRSIQAATEQVTRELALAGLAIVASAALSAWWLGGRALRPVERLRAQAAELAERADERRQLQVPATRDEIAALAATMNELLGRLHGALERERRLVADAAHELRTPLSILRAELELADRPWRSREELLAAVAAANEEAQLIGRLAEDLLFLARTDEGAPVLQRRQQPVGPILEAAAARTRRTGRRVDVEAPAQLVAYLDEGHLLQALCNLLSNADRVSPPGSAVTLRASADDVSVAFDVTDDGPGFPPDFLRRAFQRFSRADSSRARSQGGAGLGLAIVAAIAKAHGGQATASNRPEGGARVRLSLPRRAGPTPDG